MSYDSFSSEEDQGGSQEDGSEESSGDSQASDSSSLDEDTSGNWEPPQKKSKGNDALARPIARPTVVKTASGSDQTFFTTGHGQTGEAKRKGDRLVTKVTGMKRQALRAPTEPAPSHVTLHSDVKTDSGRRKYNPNDQASTHVGGIAIMGTPGTKGTGMTVDASPAYNTEHRLGHEKKVLAKPSTRTWGASTEIDLEDPNGSQRLEDIVESKRFHKDVGKDRLRKRMLELKKKSPSAKAVKKMTTKYTSDKGEEVEGDYGADMEYYCKPSWKAKDYDKDDSSGDDDIAQGVVQ